MTYFFDLTLKWKCFCIFNRILAKGLSIRNQMAGILQVIEKRNLQTFLNDPIKKKKIGQNRLISY